MLKLKVINTTASQCVPRFNYGIETCVTASSKDKTRKKILRKRQKRRSQNKPHPNR